MSISLTQIDKLPNVAIENSRLSSGLITSFYYIIIIFDE